MHAQIQNDGGPGGGGIGELILYYQPAGSDQVVARTCQSAFAPLEPKDVAEIDCYVKGDPLIYSHRIVGTDLKILPLSPTASAPRRTFVSP
jgi:hypothetical protein